MSEVTVDTIKLSFTADTSNAIKGIDALIARLNSVKTASAEISKAIGKVNSAVKSAEKSSTKVHTATQKATSPIQRNPALEGTTKTQSTSVADSEKVSNAVNEASSQTNALTNALGANGQALTSQQIAMSGTILKSQAMAGAMQFMKTAVGIATKGFQMFIGVMKKGISVISKTALKIGMMPFKRLATQVGGAVTKVAQLAAAFKRIMLYRAIRSIIKGIVSALKEGKENLYQYSVAVNGQFAKSMDMIATSALYAKNSLGAMVAPIVNALAPAIDYLTDRFVELLNKINETIASLTGAATWTKALKYPVAYADATDSATKSAKKLRATLLGFDEINRLDDNSSGSGGSGGTGMDYSKMFQEQEVDVATTDWIKKVKEAWDNADFTEIGGELGRKLQDGLDNIPWEEINSKGEQFYKSLATLINGFVEVPRLGTSIGTTIAEAINFAVNNIWTFFDTVHWDSVGEFFGEGINGFTDKFDSKKLGGTIAKVINSAVTFLHSFINKVKWDKVGKFLSDGIDGFFDELNTKELANTVSDAILGAIDLVVTFFQETDFEQIGEKIGEFIKGLDYITILGGLAAILLEGIKAAIGVLAGLIKSDPLIGLIVGGAIALKIGAFLAGKTVRGILAANLSSSITAMSTNTNVTNAASGFGTAFGKLFVAAATFYMGYHIGKWLYENVPAVQGYADTTVDVVGSLAGADKSKEGKKKTKASRSIVSNIAKATLDYINPFAEGGTPETGSLFLARESGPELVANVGRKTQVANNDQIMASISAGVEVANESQNRLLKEQNNLLRQLLSKDTTVNAIVSTDSLVSGLSRKNRRDGKAVVPLGV